MSVINVSKSQTTETTSMLNLGTILLHMDLCSKTDKQARAIEAKQLDIFASDESAESFCKELRQIRQREMSTRDLVVYTGCTKHRATAYCALAKALETTCKNKTSELVKLAQVFKDDSPSSLTFYAFVKWLTGGKKAAPKADKVSANINGGLIFTLKEGEAKPPKSYKASDLEKAIKLLDTLSNKLKALR